MKTILTTLITLLAYLPLIAQFSGGNGSSGSPYIISTASDLNEIRNYLDSHFIQVNNIDLSGYDHDGDGKGWMPIAGGGTTDKFTGRYDGQGYEIYKLSIKRPNTNNVGLFGHIGIDDDVSSISIINIGLVNVDIEGARGVGALVGRVTSNGLTKIEYAYVKNGTVVGDGALGGLVGSNNSYKETANVGLTDKPEVSKSFSDVDVIWSQNRSGDKFGGLVGCTQKGRIINSYSLSSVTVDNVIPQISGLERVGGLVGCTLNRGEVQYSYSAGLVYVPESSPTVTNTGGHIGFSEGNSVINCTYWDSETSKYLSSDGGTGYTEEQMKDETNFSCFDFTTVWGIDPEINNGYPYLLSDFGTILPVELIFFKGDFRNNKVILNWETASEINNDFFTVERSSDGVNFKEIKRLNGAGHSSFNVKYNAEDNNPLDGTSYYRIKQTDYDGTYDLSHIIAVFANKSYDKFEIYPNPGKGDFKIFSPSQENHNFVITDNKGRAVYEGVINPYENSVNLGHLTSGVYYFIPKNGQTKSSQRIIILP